MSPSPLTKSAMGAFSSFFDLATAPRINPAVPKTIGKNRKAIAPQTIPAVEKVLPGLEGFGAEKTGVGVD